MIWEKRYVFVKSMLPSFINEEFGRRVSLHGLLSPACRRAIVLSDSLDWTIQIFITGKSINFIRFSCQDIEWTSSQAQFAQDDAGQCAQREFAHDESVAQSFFEYTRLSTVLGQGDISQLERTIDAAYSSASKRLLDVFFDRYKLLDHLEAIRKYVLLCAGDFADILLEGLR